MCDKEAYKYKETLSAYAIKGKETTSRTSEKKHMMFMFACMNASNTYCIKCINICA